MDNIRENPFSNYKRFLKQIKVRLILCSYKDTETLIHRHYKQYPYQVLLQDARDIETLTFFNKRNIPVFCYEEELLKPVESNLFCEWKRGNYCALLLEEIDVCVNNNLDTLNRLSGFIPPGYFFRNLYYICHRFAIPIYGGLKKYVNNKKLCIILPDEGYGDYISVLPFWKYYLLKMKEMEWEVTLHHTSRKSLEVYQVCLQSMCIHKMEDFVVGYTNLEQILKTNHCTQYEKIMDLTYNSMTKASSQEGTDKIKLLCKLLSMPYEPAKYKFIKNYAELLPEIDLMLQTYRSHYKHIIGLQTYTNMENGTTRSWPWDYSRVFIELCKALGIGVVNLGLNEGVFSDVCDMSDYTLTQLFPVVAEMDAIVSIDSCFGHIAGVLGVDNITIWGGGTPDYSYVNNIAVSTRPFSSNISLVSQEGNIKLIKPHIVIKYLLKLLNKECSTVKKYLSYGHIKIAETTYMI